MATRIQPKRFFSGVSVRASIAHEALVEQRQDQWRPFSRDPFEAPPNPMFISEPQPEASRPPVAERKSTYSTDKRGFPEAYEPVSRNQAMQPSPINPSIAPFLCLTPSS
jgi:hypothetical protein